MARTEETRTTYETLLCNGAREAAADGTIYRDNREDEPFVVAIEAVTRTYVTDGRGRRADTNPVRTRILEISLSQAGKLADSLVSDLVYAAEVLERRVLVPEPQQED